MDLQRLPSGKFDTNFLVCALAAVAMNILRLMGQGALRGKDAPVRHVAKRRRIWAVMQELMYKAARIESSMPGAGCWESALTTAALQCLIGSTGSSKRPEAGAVAARTAWGQHSTEKQTSCASAWGEFRLELGKTKPKLGKPRATGVRM